MPLSKLISATASQALIFQGREEPKIFDRCWTWISLSSLPHLSSRSNTSPRLLAKSFKNMSVAPLRVNVIGQIHRVGCNNVSRNIRIAALECRSYDPCGKYRISIMISARFRMFTYHVISAQRHFQPVIYPSGGYANPYLNRIKCDFICPRINRDSF